MKKNTFKKVILPILFVVVITLSSVIAIWSAKRTDELQKAEMDAKTTVPGTAEINPENTTVPATETELVTEMVTEVVTKKNADGKVVTSVKEVPTVVEVITKKASSSAATAKSVSGTTAKTTTTTKSVSKTTTTTKPVKKPTTTKPVVTTQKPKPTKPATTSKPKDEYYPSLTAADMEEVKQCAINYIKQRGYKVEPQITWTNSTWGGVVGTDDDLSKYGNRYKLNGGINPKTEAKTLIKKMVDTEIRAAEAANDGTGEVYGIYPLVRHQNGAWQWAVGTW